MGRRLLFGLLLLFLLGAAPVRDGEEAWERGDAAGALLHWSEALAAAREAGDVSAQVDLLVRLAAVHRHLGRFGTADDAVAQADALATQPADDARVEVARGLLELARGDARRAEKTLAAAFQAAQAAKEPRVAADAATNLGLARMALGRQADAARALRGAETLFRSLGDDRGRADVLTNLGAVLRRTGELSAARSTLEEAVRLFRAAGDGAGEADALTNLALVLQDLGQPARARELLEGALATARTRRDVGRQATLLLDLGALAQAEGDPVAAGAAFRTAEEAFTSLGRTGDALSAALDAAVVAGGERAALEDVLRRAKKAGVGRIEAIAALDLAAMLRDRDPSAAARHAERALALAEREQLAEVRWRARYVLGVLAVRGGKRAEGVARLREAVDELERTRRALAGAESASFLVGHEPVYQALIDALLAEGDSLGAFVYAERLQLADLDEPPVPAGDPEVARYRELVARELWLGDEIARAKQDPERREALAAELSQLRVAFASTVDELRSSYLHFDELVRVDPEDLEAVQADLEPGVVVLQPILLEDRLALLVFRRDLLKAVTVEVDGQEVRRTANRLARSLQAGHVFDPAWTASLGDQLGAWLIAPIAAELEGADVLVVSATGPFRQLPFGVLRHEGRWLIEDRAVVGITHVGSLRRRDATEPGLRLDGRGLLLVGDPDGTLPAAQEEVERIALRFPGADVLIGAQGTREQVWARADGKRALHLATHGVLDPVRPDRSHLVLAGEGGRLSYREIPGLAPYLDRCRLVVLSACESGLPVEALRPEDADGGLVVSINGLAAQFRRAGVETLVASLWQVDDDATLALMDGFYGELAAGRDVARALQRAQVAMLADPDRAHPFYWGAFVVVGDWR